MQKSRLIDKIKKLPKTPGVYIFKDNSGAVLYVGKATSLRDRVKSYFLISERFNFSRPKRPKEVEPLNFSRPVETAIGQIVDIKTIETETVLEAFILEQDLIKRLQPKYNAMGKDDKSFSYVVVTKEDFPRFIILRKTEISQIFNFQFSIFNQFSISKFSKNNSLKAKSYQLKASKIYGPYTSKKHIEIVLKILRKIFPYHSRTEKSEKGCLDYQIGLCPGPYAGGITRFDYLKNIRGIRMILEGKKKGLVKKLEKEMREHSKKHEYEKAGKSRNKIFALKHIRDVALIAKSDENFEFRISNFETNSNFKNSNFKINSKFKIQNSKFRIEAYDISNISGQHAVGSMVVFDNHTGNFEANKSEYRKFKIKTIQGADDVGMMKEVLTRRFNNNWPRPNLILLDGGVGHLNMAGKLLKNLKLSIPVVAVAKGPTRKNSKLEILNPKQIQNSKLKKEIEIFLSDKNLIKQIMDEAHRFAITYHKKLRRDSFI